MSWISKMFIMRSASVTIMASSGYVAYRDYIRYPRMIYKYSCGSLIPPFNNNENEISYFLRPEIENRLKEMFDSSFSNTYYVINGEVGNGKSRVIVETVRRLISEYGNSELGAPIYVCSHQGKSFADVLANSVDYRYDEHISFQAFMDGILSIHQLPFCDETHKLERVLDGIEKSAQRYAQEKGRPVVIIIDDIEKMMNYNADSLRLLQDKAKLWADLNIVKMVFVCYTEESGRRLRKSSSAWSRAATPLYIGDLRVDSAKLFLKNCNVMICAKEAINSAEMPDQYINEIVAIVGGRIQTLVDVKRRWAKGDSAQKVTRDLKQKEREKLLDLEFLSVDKRVDDVLKKLLASDSKGINLSYFVKLDYEKAIDQLSSADVIKLRRTNGILVVEFESILTRLVVKEFIEH